jgi:DNA repair protein SbcD/Mre11
LIKDAGIPVVAIEGNHDQKHSDSDYSWLRSLANWNLIHLLEPTNDEGKIGYKSWDRDTGRGGFIDLGRARIFGSHWYGAAANWAIPMLTEAIRENRRDGAFHLLMLHTDVEGHQTHPIPALSLSALKELKSVTDYVALGHTHMHYEIDNWAFNPGSIEVTNISEFREKRGVFVVKVDEQNNVSAKHIEEYRHRPFQRMSFEVDRFADTKELTAAVLEKVSKHAQFAEADKPAPIIEITLRGQLGFPNSVLELKEIREKAQEITGALHVRIKNNSVPVDYAVAADIEEDASREKLERRVVEDLVIRDNRFKTKVGDISEAVIGAKRLALSDEEPEKIAEFIGAKLAQG